MYRLSFLLLLISASCTAHAAEAYDVSLQIFQNARLVGSPSLIVEDDKPASIRVGGENGYEISVTTHRVQPDLIDVLMNLAIDHDSIAPEMLVPPDEKASVAVGDIKVAIVVSPYEEPS